MSNEGSSSLGAASRRARDDRHTDSDAPYFPYPGPRVLSRWVGDEVKHQFRKGASTDEVLAAVRKVLDAHEEKYGERPADVT